MSGTTRVNEANAITNDAMVCDARDTQRYVCEDDQAFGLNLETCHEAESNPDYDARRLFVF